MSSYLDKINQKIFSVLYCSQYEKLLKLVCVLGIFLLSSSVFADDDILAGTATSLTATLNGTGKTYLYIAEGVLSLAAYIKTKNLLFLAGIVVVAAFFNIMMKVAGVTQ